jgi:hypothetical protein
MTDTEGKACLRVAYVSNAEDLLAFALVDEREGPRLFPKRRGRVWPRVFILWGVLLVVLALVLAVEANQGKWPDSGGTPGLLQALLVTFVVFVPIIYAAKWIASWTGLHRFRLAIDIRVGIERGRIRSMEPVCIEMTPDALRTQTPDAETTRMWSHVLFVVRGPDGIYMYLSPFEAVLVPRRAFRDDAEFEHFHQAAVEAQRAAHPAATPEKGGQA